MTWRIVNLAAVFLLWGVAPQSQGAAAAAMEALVLAESVNRSPSAGSLIALKDGRLLWTWTKGARVKPYHPVNGNLSSDGGKTWSAPVPLQCADGQTLAGALSTSLVRLKSGALGLAVGGGEELRFHVSRDEGKTWSQGVRVHSPLPRVAFTNDRGLVLSGGRVVLPVYTIVEGPKLPVRKPRVRAHGEEFDTGWAHWMMYAYVFFSDDDGATWKRSDNEVFVTRELGLEGIYSAQEPAVAELADGKLLMLVRTSLGRLYRSTSADRGATWQETGPTPLIGPAAAVSLRRIPGTDAVLAIWNQVASFEVMQGLYRHRLSCAVSRDGGVTWANFKNLESLDDTARLADEPPAIVLMGLARQPLDRKRYHRTPGPLRVSYPTCTFIDGRVVITYGLSTLGDKETIVVTYGLDYDEVVRRLGYGPEARANKVRVIPQEWFFAP